VQKNILLLLLLTAMAYAEPKPEYTAYDKFALTSFMFSSENLLNAGYYRQESNKTTFNMHYLPFRFKLATLKERYRLSLHGNAGWSQYSDQTVSDTQQDFLIYGMKLGGDLDVALGKSTHAGIRMTYLYAYGKDKSSSSLSRSYRDHLYEFSGYLTYHPVWYRYKSYIMLEAKQQTGDIGADHVPYTSWITKCNAGVFLPGSFTISKVTVRSELYLAEIMMAGDIKRILDENRFDIAGVRFYLGNPLHLPWVKDSRMEYNYVHASKMHGINFAIGVDF
jgi:hypothetical protein